MTTEQILKNLNQTGLSEEGHDITQMGAKIKEVADTIPIKPLGFYVLVRMETVEKTHKVKGTDVELVMMSDEHQKRENKANPKGWILAFGPTCYKGFAGHGDDGLCAGPSDWGVEVGDYVEFQSHDGILSSFDETDTLRIIPDSNIISKVEVKDA